MHWSVIRTGDVIIARFSNPPMGYFTAAAAQELSQLIDEWEQSDARAIVLTGAEGRFITHYSVEELIAFGEDREAMESIGTALSDGYHALLRRLATLGKPVVAAIGGDCMGGGLELAMWCDIRVAERGDFRLGLPEVRLGIMPGGSGTQRLVDLLGEGKAREMILTGCIVTPERAHAIGLVHHLSGDALQEAIRIAADLASLNPRAIANIKLSLEPSGERLSREANAFLDTMRSEEAILTMRRYIQTAPERRRAFLDDLD